MSDPLHTDSRAPQDDGVDRDTRIEDLLLTGLDHYFRAEYEQAIHVWTRVLFLDRGHTRARAYIERARGASAERQRESEELLDGGVAAFDSGDVHAARRLLSSAVERGGPQDVALALLDRLDRLVIEGRGPTPARDLPEQDGPGRHAADRKKRAFFRRRQTLRAREAETKWGWGPTLKEGSRAAFWLVPLALVAIGIAATLALSPQSQRSTSFPWPRAGVPAPPVIDEPLPVISPAEAAIGRARALVARGRLHEALRALETVRRGDPLRADADALRAAVQRAILTGGPKQSPR